MIKFKDLVGVLHSSELNNPCCNIRLLVEDSYTEATSYNIKNFEALECFIKKYGDYTVFSMTAVERNLVCIRIQYFKEENEEENNDKEI